MRHRSLVSLAAAVGIVLTVAVVPFSGAASASTGTAIRHVARTSHAATPTALPRMSRAAHHSPAAMLPVNPLNATRGATLGTGANAPTVRGDTVVGATPGSVTPTTTLSTVLVKFNGLSNVTSTNANGFQVTPPDQALCAGRDPTLPGAPNVVFEGVNEVLGEYSTTGALLRPVVSLAALFHTSFANGDIRCVYDPAHETFYFTEINNGGTIYTKSGVDVAVLNAKGLATYTFPTSMTGHCLGDQPKTGFDLNALVISTDEYCTLLTTHPSYPGAIILVISKPQLINERMSVNYWTSTALSDAGYPVVGLDPAIGVPRAVETLVNSVPYLTNVRTLIDPIGNKIGEARVYNTRSVTNGTGAPVVTLTTMTSEYYAFPVRATSTGTGAVSTVTGFAVYSVASLNPDDSRMSGPVEVTVTNGHTMLWTALSAAVTPKGTSTVRDGAAWFEIDATNARIVRQGYVAAKHSYLIYPAILAPQTKRSVPLVFTITSPTLNPSAGFTTLGSGNVTVVAHGFGPQMTFDAPGFRWGDYSFVATGTNGIWMATEYIPPKTDQAKFANWGTEVFEVRP